MYLLQASKLQVILVKLRPEHENLNRHVKLDSSDQCLFVMLLEDLIHQHLNLQDSLFRAVL